jgi:hypothetical protein
VVKSGPMMSTNQSFLRAVSQAALRFISERRFQLSLINQQGEEEHVAAHKG